MVAKDVITGLDIGTTKVCAIIGELNKDGEIEIIGVGEQPSHGLRQGIVVNVEDTVRSISEAVEEAELMAGIDVNSVYVGIAGGHIQSQNSRGVIATEQEDREITERDVHRVIEAAEALSIPPDRELIHTLPQEFYVDEQDHIKDPVGMSGVRLEADVHVVTAALPSVQNIVKSVFEAGLEVEDIVLEPLASSYAVLDDDEKELGVCLVDIGGGTSDMAIFARGYICDTDVIQVGGEHVTQDVMTGLRTSKQDAERIKIDHGCAVPTMVPEDDTLEVPSVGGRKPRERERRRLCEIIEPRMEEIFQFIEHSLQESGYMEQVIAGMVVTGGASGLKGTEELAEDLVDMPVRVGEPWGVSGLVDVVNNPKYSTGVGLVKYGYEQRGEEEEYQISPNGNLFGQLKQRMSGWFTDLGSWFTGA